MLDWCSRVVKSVIDGRSVWGRNPELGSGAAAGEWTNAQVPSRCTMPNGRCQTSKRFPFRDRRSMHASDADRYRRRLRLTDEITSGLAAFRQGRDVKWVSSTELSARGIVIR